ncbi:MAG: ModD protein [Sulfurimonas sp.]|jgi:molybdenum transport protein|nr:ModD protein [Sulfurimonas sp.]
MRISDAELEAIIQEDIGYGDLTSQALGLDTQTGVMRFVSRSEILVLALMPEAARMCSLLGLEVVFCQESKSLIKKGALLLEVRGEASALHQAWKSVQNLLDYSCGIATYTHELVTKAKEINPDIVVATTRKNPPYLKKIALSAVRAGGGIAHRINLSETLLIFGHHRTFFPTQEALEIAVQKAKKQNPEKKLVIEAKTQSEALAFAKMGADALQLDKFSLEDLASTSQALRNYNPQIKIIATGGITKENVQSYAALDVDMIVTSSPYFAKPADVKVEMFAEGENFLKI